MIEINPRDAKNLDLNDGKYIRVSTRRGSVVARAWVTERVPENTVFMTFHSWEACGNELTNTATDNIAGTPEFKVAAAKVEKISPAEAQTTYQEKEEKYLVGLEKEITRLAMGKGGKVDG